MYPIAASQMRVHKTTADGFGNAADVDVWPSGLVRWLVDFERTIVGSNPGYD